MLYTGPSSGPYISSLVMHICALIWELIAQKLCTNARCFICYELFIIKWINERNKFFISSAEKKERSSGKKMLNVYFTVALVSMKCLFQRYFSGFSHSLFIVCAFCCWFSFIRFIIRSCLFGKSTHFEWGGIIQNVTDAGRFVHPR